MYLFYFIYLSCYFYQELLCLFFIQNKHNQYEIHKINHLRIHSIHNHHKNLSMTFTPQHHKPDHYKVSSLTQQCLRNLRDGGNSKQPKIHLLGFMSQYITDKQQVKYEEVEELCCYDRMKKLLLNTEDTKAERKQKEKVLEKAVQIQGKMNQMERTMKQRTTTVLNNGTINSGKSNSSQSKGIFKDINKSRLNSRSGVMTASACSKSKTQHETNNNRLLSKNSIINSLKQKSYEKFFKFQKIQKENDINKIKNIIGEQFQTKFHKVIEEKDLSKHRLMDENKMFERKILQKNVEIQTLRSERNYLKGYVKQLQQKLFGANNQLQNAHLIKSYEAWLSQYKQNFGQMSIKQLNDYIEQIKNKCLDKFDQIQNKNDEKLKELNNVFEIKNQKIKKDIEKLQFRENQLIEINRNLKLNKQISEMEINQLIKSNQQLKSLQKLILSLYNQWYEKRTENQKTIMKKFDKLQQNYSYEQMLEYIVFYDKKLSTNDKLNDYILKVLRGIQKIRRMIFPMQSNEKLDPFVVLDKIQQWTNQRLKQQNKKKRNVKNSIDCTIKDKKEYLLQSSLSHKRISGTGSLQTKTQY